MAYYRGLRHAELMELQLEKIQKTDEGLYITHSRCKQRTDKRDSRYLVPNEGPAEVVSSYIKPINDDLGVFSSRVFYRGNHMAFFSTLIGKNLVSKVPAEVAQLLKRENPNTFTFHSLRRTSATIAVDQGASMQQMTDFYGWSNTNMPQEYVSTRKKSCKLMAEKLLGAVDKTTWGNTNSSCTTTSTSASDHQKQPLIVEKSGKVVIIDHFSGTFNF